MVATAGIAGEHGSFNCIHQAAPVCMISWPHPYGISIGSAVFAGPITNMTNTETHRPRYMRHL